jgi:hypothetical protein
VAVTEGCCETVVTSADEKTGGDAAGGGATADGRTGVTRRGGTTSGGTTSGGTTSGGTLNVGGAGGSVEAGTGPVEGGAGSGGAPIVTAGAGGTEAGGMGGDAGSGGGDGNECVGRVEQELLVDGSFDVYDNAEEGTPWLQTTTNDYYILGDEEDNAVILTEPRSAWLGGFDATVTEETGDYYVSVIWQDVTIPLGTVRLSAQCQVLVQTDVNDEVHALLEFMLQDSDTFDQLTLLENVNNRATENVWFEIGRDIERPELERLDLLDRTVTVALAAFNDDEDAANFFVDNCSIVATICP